MIGEAQTHALDYALTATQWLELLVAIDGLDPAPLVLVNRRTPQQYNTLHREILGRGQPAIPTLLVHPDDAADRGLASGDVAVISTANGSCRSLVEVTDAIRPGVVSLPHGFDAANVNQLTSTADADPLSGMTIVSGLPVDVSPCGELPHP